MNFEEKYIDELIELRKEARKNKDWKLSDKIRDTLDNKLVFVFDTNWGQEVYYLNENYFNKNSSMSKRQFLEYRIKQDINAEKNFEAWLYSMQKKREILRESRSF